MSYRSRGRVIVDDAATTPAGAWRPKDLSTVQPAGTVTGTPDPVAEAYTLGFEEGRHEGEVAEAARLRAAREAAEEALDIIRVNEERWSDSIDENIVALSIAVARHVVDQELALDPAIVARIVSRTLDEFPIDQPVRIRVSPGDLALLESNGAARMGTVAGAPARSAHWLADPRVVSGGCVVEGRDRIIDGRVDTALERLYRRLAHQHA